MVRSTAPKKPKNSNSSNILRATRLLKQSVRPMILTGAGVSVASGVPPFRGEGGLWDDEEFAKFAYAKTLKKDPDSCWEAFEAARALIERCAPNPAHLALARLLELKPKATLVTQNVDGLHGEKAIELHGSLHRFRCIKSCGHIQRAEPQKRIAAKDAVCPDCNARLRHDVVLFGETLPLQDRLMARLASTDFVLYVGTSGTVTPTKDIARSLKKRGIPVVEINPDASTESSAAVEIYLRSKAELILPKMMDD